MTKYFRSIVLFLFLFVFSSQSIGLLDCSGVSDFKILLSLEEIEDILEEKETDRSRTKFSFYSFVFDQNAFQNGSRLYDHCFFEELHQSIAPKLLKLKPDYSLSYHHLKLPCIS